MVQIARDFWQKSLSYADAADANRIKPAQGIEVTIYLAGTTTKAQVFGSRNPTDVTPLPNPITSPASGLVEFWGEYGSYDIAVHDTIVPLRISDKTFGWEATSGADRGTPTVKVAGDGNLLYASKDAMNKRQDVPLGTKLDWWRPNSTYDAGAGAGQPPPGFEICDGRTIVQANHDFGAIGSIVMPDCRNAFVLGANVANADAAAAVANSDAVGSGPGIRGAGGTHSQVFPVPPHFHNARSTGASLAIAASGSHTHTATDPGHSHQPRASATQTPPDGSTIALGNAGGAAIYALGNAGPIIVNTTGIVNVAATHTHINSDFSGTVGLVTGGQNGDAAFNTTAADGKPKYVGFLMIMKVRRS